MYSLPLKINLGFKLPDDDQEAMSLIADRLQEYGGMERFQIDMKVGGKIAGTVYEIKQALRNGNERGKEFLKEQRSRAAA